MRLLLYNFTVDLQQVPGRLAIARLDATEALPEWAQHGAPLVSITRTGKNLSVVCPEEWIPDHVQCSIGWFCLKVVGPIDLAAVGILAALVIPLRDEGISVFALATYDTDYLLLPEAQRDNAIGALVAAGHRIKL
jgi:hypothetical protein